jgi:hypothetical protein
MAARPETRHVSSPRAGDGIPTREARGSSPENSRFPSLKNVPAGPAKTLVSRAICQSERQGGRAFSRAETSNSRAPETTSLSSSPMPPIATRSSSSQAARSVPVVVACADVQPAGAVLRFPGVLEPTLQAPAGWNSDRVPDPAVVENVSSLGSLAARRGSSRGSAPDVVRGRSTDLNLRGALQ